MKQELEREGWLNRLLRPPPPPPKKKIGELKYVQFQALDVIMDLQNLLLANMSQILRSKFMAKTVNATFAYQKNWGGVND